jgi:pimeloyl-ACP methyl ester carboxylesterase
MGDSSHEACEAQPVPIAFGPRASQTLGFYHRPAPGLTRDVGIVLCSPLGYEAMCTQRTYRHMASRLAAAGFPTLRFDYHGTGDSAGKPSAGARLREWLENVDAAIEELEFVVGVSAVHLIGVRLGATLASIMAARRTDVQALVLWSPCFSGRTYVRELRALGALQNGAHSAHARLAGDAVAGYWLNASTLDDVSQVDLRSTRAPCIERALIVPRGDIGDGAERLAARFADRGIEATVWPGPGYARMMRDPQDAAVPHAAIEAIVSWLSSTRRTGDTASSAQRIRGTVALTPHQAAQPLLREEPVRFGSRGDLFGVLTRPARGLRYGDRPAVLFLNAGATHRVGPGRLYVSLARRLAGSGYVCLRLDRAGLGDSTTRRIGMEGRVYCNDQLEDVQAAITFLATRAASRAVVVGVCSGAFAAFRAAVADPRIAGQVLINPQSLEWVDRDPQTCEARVSYKSTRHYLDATLRQEVWARLLRRDLDVLSVAAVLRDRVAARGERALARLSAALQGLPLPQSEVEVAFCALADRGVRSLLVVAANDGSRDMLEDHLGRGATRLRKSANVRMEVVTGADHTFTSRGAQRGLTRLVTRFVERAFP